MIHFETPLALILLIGIPLFAAPKLCRGLLYRLLTPFSSGTVGAFLLRFWAPLTQSSAGLSFSSPIEISELSTSIRHKLRSLCLPLLATSAFTLLVIALARPQFGNRFVENEASGRDIILALDVSGSMSAMDFFLERTRVDRLTALKQVVKQFIDDRQGDRIGLVVFGGTVFTQCPLTTDYRVLKEYVDLLEVGMGGEGTAIGDGLAVALKRIKSLDAESKTVVLVTDGKSNWGTLSPEQAAEVAKKLKIKVHVVGIGGKGTAPFPVEGIFGKQLVNRALDYDESTLKLIADSSRGRYFNATSLEQLKDVYTEIDKLEYRIETTSEYVEYEERFVPFVALAVAALLLLEISSITVFLRVP